MDSSAPMSSSSDPTSDARSDYGLSFAESHATLMLVLASLALIGAVVALIIAFDARNDVQDASSLTAEAGSELSEDLDARTATAKATITDLEASTKNAADQQQQLQKQITANTKAIEDNGASDARNAQEVTTLQNDVNKVESDIDQIEQRLAAIESDLDAVPDAADAPAPTPAPEADADTSTPVQ